MKFESKEDLDVFFNSMPNVISISREVLGKNKLYILKHVCKILEPSKVIR